MDNQMDATNPRSADAALNRSTLPTAHRTRLRRGLWSIVVIVLLFYLVAGYLGCSDMFGDHPRWRGMNRGPADFGLQSETVSSSRWMASR